MYNRLIPMIHTVSTSKYNLKRKNNYKVVFSTTSRKVFLAPARKKYGIRVPNMCVSTKNKELIQIYKNSDILVNSCHIYIDIHTYIHTYIHIYIYTRLKSNQN